MTPFEMRIANHIVRSLKKIRSVEDLNTNFHIFPIGTQQLRAPLGTGLFD